MDTLIGTNRAAIRKAAAKKIAMTEDHPLKFLLNEKGEFKSPKGLSHDELFSRPDILEMGHVVSKKSGELERIVLQSAWFNQFDRITVEGKEGLSYVENVAVDIGGIGVELRTAKDWVKAGMLPEEILRSAPRINF